MLSRAEFIRQSLGVHLFEARIMKEHAYFMAAGFTPANPNLILRANELKAQFSQLLSDTVDLSKGVVDPTVLSSGEVVTPYTLDAETTSQKYTGMPINTAITKAELRLTGGGTDTFTAAMENRVSALNDRAIRLLASIIQFKTLASEGVQSCRVFSHNYPSMIAHLIEEARHYLETVQKLQNKQETGTERQSGDLQVFWNHIMGDHAYFIRGLLDPSEKELIATANSFGMRFDALEEQTRQAVTAGENLQRITAENFRATREIQAFKMQAVQGILACRIKTIALPLLADHVLREASHYLRLLNKFTRFTAFLG